MAKPSLLRHLMAVFYDFLLLVAVLFFATALILPFNGGKAFNPHQVIYPLYLTAVSFLFYAWFWTHGGQTLGLKAWKLKILSETYEPIGWRQAFVRFSVAIISWACLGLGFFWVFINKNRLTWHDIASNTGLFLTVSPNSKAD